MPIPTQFTPIHLDGMTVHVSVAKERGGVHREELSQGSIYTHGAELSKEFATLYLIVYIETIAPVL